MNPTTPDASRPQFEVRGAQAASVIVHRVPADCVERFMDWQRGITQVVKAAPGYQSTDVYPPADSCQLDWVVVIHFDNSQALQRWLNSPERAEWTAKLPAEIADFRLKTLSAGFGPWFTRLVDDGGLPPDWKMALAVLFGLYPIVMLLTILVAPHVSRLGVAVAMLISNILSVALLQWCVMPAISFVFGPWLRANGAREKTFSLIGLLLIVGVLGALTLIFHLATV